MAVSFTFTWLIRAVLTTVFDTTWELLTPASIAQAIGAIAAILALIISSVHICRHWMYNKTKLRKATVRLLFVVPIFAIDAWACLMLEASTYQWAALLTCVREVYEAIALVSFMELVLTMLGGSDHLAISMLESNTGPVEHIGPLRRILPAYEPGPEFVRSVLLGILQYVFVTLGFFLVIFMIWSLQFVGVSEDMCHALEVVPNVVKAASCGWALTCLVLFAREVKHRVPKCGLVLKFLSIKGIVFFTFWQGIVIFFLQHSGWLAIFEQFVQDKSRDLDLNPHWWSTPEIKSGLNDFLLCFEVLFFSVLHLYAYPAREGQQLPQILQERILDSSADDIHRVVSVVNLINVLSLHEEVERLSLIQTRSSEVSRAIGVANFTDAVVRQLKSPQRGGKQTERG
eukprot:TRINITY_DN73848_c0_g1_i1.p1 TRINITY_DN73848_c0_g1~~TRINITY_DN73848_c0_g1_i1.p1  ORF type:complete len:400 (-),score=50.28 TRINITY_DN73848_c0_g1_i1:77-1276(-)